MNRSAGMPSDPITGKERLRRQLERFRGLSPVQCSFVRSPGKGSEFEALTDAQRSYYLWYRHRFMDGEFPASDIGYSKLLLIDLINDRSDTHRVMEALWHYRDARERDSRAYPGLYTVDEAMFCYAVANDLPIPRIRYLSEEWSRAAISEALLPYPEDLSGDLLDVLTGGASSRGDPKATALFNASLRPVDRFMRRRSGRGILETHCRGERTLAVGILAVSGLQDHYLYDPVVTVVYTDPDDSLPMFLGAMYRYCMTLVSRETGDMGTSVSSIFPKGLRRIVDEILAQEDDSVPDGKPEPLSAAASGTPENLSRPVVRPLPHDARYVPGSSLRQAMQRFSGIPPVGVRAYVPSGCSTPEYARMDTAALEYYLYWREQARSGRYGETDDGYLWLYRCELINTDPDTGHALGQLAGLSRAYDGCFGRNQSNVRRIPGETYLDYALIRHPYGLDPTVRPGPVTSGVLLRMLLEGRDPPVCADNILTLADIGSSKEDRGIRASFTDDCARIAARVIARINRICIDKGGQVSGFCGLRTGSEERSAFGGLRYYGDDSRIVLRLPSYADNQRFLEGTRTLVRTVVRAVQDRGKPLRPVWIYGAEASDIVAEETENWLSGKPSETPAVVIMEEAPPTLIDRSAVDAAEEDLRRVTELMGTEQEDPADDREAVGVPSPDVLASSAADVRSMQDDGDPWKAMAARLDKAERRYLRGILSGTPVAVSTMLEAFINDAAMDTVRDAIVENGRVYDEYADDIRRTLGPEVPTDDRWRMFAKQLGRGQMEYLERIVSGADVSARPVLETAINRAAVETLGRTVVGDGRMPDECVPPMKELFERWNRR